MQGLSAAHPAHRTRSGKTYGTAYSLPQSFSVANALQNAVEVENEEAEGEDDDEGDETYEDRDASTLPTHPTQSSARGGHCAASRPFPSVHIEEVDGVDAPPPPKRKIPPSAEDAPPLQFHPRFNFSFHRSGFPSTDSHVSSAKCTSVPAPIGKSNGCGEGGGANAGGGAQPNRSGKEKRRRRKNEHRAKMRQAERAEEMRNNSRRPRKKDVDSRVAKDKAISTDVNICELPADSSGYGATYANAQDEQKEVLNLERLESEGYAVIEWDGREPLLFQEPEAKKLVVIAVGIPEDESYTAACEAIHRLFLRLGEENQWEDRYVDHKRGNNWPALNMGMAYGFGNQPYNQANVGHEGVVEELLSSPELRRIAIHQSESLRFYVPGIYDYYHKRTRSFREANTHLRINWDGSVYSSAACNLGPQVATFMHRDCMNLPFGFCAIHAFGNYDHTKGGHLVLKELKIIIQFPPGALILIPSATLTHGNVPVQEGETRTSFTQYTAGALFRFVDNGFRSEKRFKKCDPKGYRKAQEEKHKRWAMGLGLWSTVEDLLQRFNKPPMVGPL